MSELILKAYNTLVDKNILDPNDMSADEFQNLNYDNPNVRKFTYDKLVEAEAFDPTDYKFEEFEQGFNNTAIKNWNRGSSDDATEVWYEHLGTVVSDFFISQFTQITGITPSEEAQKEMTKRHSETLGLYSQSKQIPERVQTFGDIIAENVGYVSTYFSEATGQLTEEQAEELRKSSEKNLHNLYTKFANMNQKYLQPYIDAGIVDKNNLDSFGSSQTLSLAQNLPFLFAGMATRGLPFVSNILRGAGIISFIGLEASDLTGQIYAYDAKRDDKGFVVPETGNLKAAQTALPFGILSGAVETLGLENLAFKGLSKDAANSFLKRIFKDYGKAIITEGVEEGIQNSIGQVAEMVVNQRRRFDPEEVLTSIGHGMYGALALSSIMMPIESAFEGKNLYDLQKNIVETMPEKINKLEEDGIIGKEKADKFKASLEVIKNTKPQDLVEAVNEINKGIKKEIETAHQVSIEKIRQSIPFKRILQEENGDEVKAFQKYYDEFSKPITLAGKSVEQIAKVISNENMTYEEKLAKGLSQEQIDKLKAGIEQSPQFLLLQQSIQEGTVEEKKNAVHEIIMKNSPDYYLNAAFNTILPTAVLDDLRIMEIEETTATNERIKNIDDMSALEPQQTTITPETTQTMAEEQKSAVEPVMSLEEEKVNIEKRRQEEFLSLLSEEDQQLALKIPEGEKRTKWIKNKALKVPAKIEKGKLVRESGQTINSRHKAEDALSNPDSSLAEKVTARFSLENDYTEYNPASVSDITRFINEDFSKMEEGENRAGWTEERRRLKQIYDEELKKTLKQQGVEDVTQMQGQGRKEEITLRSLEELNSLAKSELNTIAKGSGIKGYSKLKKAELAQMIFDNQQEPLFEEEPADRNRIDSFKNAMLDYERREPNIANRQKEVQRYYYYLSDSDKALFNKAMSELNNDKIEYDTQFTPNKQEIPGHTMAGFRKAINYKSNVDAKKLGNMLKAVGKYNLKYNIPDGYRYYIVSTPTEFGRYNVTVHKGEGIKINELEKPLFEEEPIPNEVKYSLKSVEILSTDKAIKVFEKGKKNNWDLNKILTELQIPKEQKELLLSLGLFNREEIILELVSKYNFPIEINVTKKPLVTNINDNAGGLVQRTDPNGEPTSYYSNLTVLGGINYTENEINIPTITPSIKGHPQFATDTGIGWFRSDEQSTKLALTFDIKDVPNEFEGYNSVLGLETYQGTVKKINDKWYLNNLENNLQPISEEQVIKLYTRKERPTSGSNIRRILEIQSDLFQKGRNSSRLEGSVSLPVEFDYFINLHEKKNIISDYLALQKKYGFELGEVPDADYFKDEFVYNDEIYYRTYDMNDDGSKGEEAFWYKGRTNITKKEYDKIYKKFSEKYTKDNEKTKSILNEIKSEYNTYYEKQMEKIKNSPANQFLTLLSKNDNWITFFVKTIVQDSAKKGYRTVLFPKGETAAKIEGHETLASEIEDENKFIKELEESSIIKESDGTYSIYIKTDIIGVSSSPTPNGYLFNGGIPSITEAESYRDFQIQKSKEKIDELKFQGIEKLKPIENFYENRITNILNKIYGKENVNTITDKYGNEWNEVQIVDDRDKAEILFEEESILNELKDEFPHVVFKSFSDMNNRLASTKIVNGKYVISVAQGITKEQFQEYISGNFDDSMSSKQKKLIWDSVDTKRPHITPSEVEFINSLTDKDLYRFLIYHEESHAENDDVKSYPRLKSDSKKFDYMSNKAIQIEQRATKDAIARLKADIEKRQQKKYLIDSNSDNPFLAVLSLDTTTAKKNGKIKGDYPVRYNGKFYNDVLEAFNALKDAASDKQLLLDELIELRFRQNPLLIDKMVKTGFVNELEHIYSVTNGFYSLSSSIQKAVNKILQERELQKASQPLSDLIGLLTSGQQLEIDYESNTGRRTRTVRNVRMISGNTQFKAEQKEGNNWVEKTFSIRNLKAVNSQQMQEPIQTTTPKQTIAMNFKDGDGGQTMRPEFAGKSTMDLILSGDRTATSRDYSKDYNKLNAKVGDVVEFTDKQGRKVLVRITTEPKPIKDIPREEWSKKEGWDVSVYDRIVNKGDYRQFEYELVQTTTQAEKVSPEVSMEATEPSVGTLSSVTSQLKGNPLFYDSISGEFVDWVMDKAKNIKVEFVDDDFVIQGHKMQGKRGAYFNETIYINKSIQNDYQKLYRTIGHESTHYLTSRALDDLNKSFYNRLFRGDVDKIFDEAMEAMRKDTEFWNNPLVQEDIKRMDYDRNLPPSQLRRARTKAIQEFVAHVMSNTSPHVNKWLRENGANSKSKDSFFRKFINRVKEFFKSGIKDQPVSYYNALEVVFSRYFDYKVDYADALRIQVEGFEKEERPEAFDIMEAFNEENLSAINVRNVVNMIKDEKDFTNWHKFITSISYNQFFGKLMSNETFLKSSEAYFNEKFSVYDQMEILEGKLSQLEEMKSYYRREEALAKFRSAIATKFYNYANSLHKTSVKRLVINANKVYKTKDNPEGIVILDKRIEDLPETYFDKNRVLTSSYRENILADEFLPVLKEMFNMDFEIVHLDDIQWNFFDPQYGYYVETVWKGASKADFDISDRNNYYADKLKDFGLIYLGAFADKNTNIALMPKLPEGTKLEDIDFSNLTNFYENKMLQFFDFAEKNGVMKPKDLEAYKQSTQGYNVNKLSHAFHLLFKDLGLGATFTNGKLNNVIFNPEYLEAFGKDVYNAVNIMKRAIQVLPKKEVVKDRGIQKQIFDNLSEQDKVGINFSEENGITFNTAIISEDSKATISISLPFMEEPVKVRIADILKNEFGTDEFDGANIYVGGWGKIARELSGATKQGPIKGKMLHSYGQAPYYNKGAWFQSNSTILRKWMEENDIALLTFSSAAKINTNPQSELLGEELQVIPMSFDNYYHDTEKNVSTDEATGIAQSLTTFFNHSSNSTFAQYPIEIRDRIIEALVDNFNKTMYSINGSTLISSIRKSLFESKSNQESVLANAMVDMLYDIVGTKAQQEIADESIAKEIGNAFLEPSIASLLKSHIKRQLKGVTKAKITSTWMTLRPDFGWLEPENIKSIHDNIKADLRKEVKETVQSLLAKVVNIEQAINKTTNAEKIEKLTEAKERLEKEINILNNTDYDAIATEDLEEMIDMRTGKLKDGWCYIAEDINNVEEYNVKFKDNVIATIVPGSDISSQSAPRVAGFIKKVDKGVLTMNSGYVQTVGGRDFDIDQLLITPFTSRFFTRKGYAEYTNAINQSKDNFIKKLKEEYRKVLGEDLTDAEIFSEETHKRYMQAVTKSGQTGQKIYNPLTQSLSIGNKFTKEIGQVLNDNKIFTAQAQIGFKTKIAFGGKEYTLDPRKGISDFPLVASRLLHDNVDKPTNTNAFFYDMDLFTKFSIIYGIKDKIGEVSKGERESLNNIFRVIQSVNNKLFKYGTKLSSDNNLLSFGAERGLEDDLMYIHFQQTINEWIRTKNVDALYKFINPRIEDAPIVEFYLSNLEVEDFSESYSMKVIELLNLKAIPNLFVSKEEYAKWQEGIIELLTKTNETYKKILISSLERNSQLVKDIYSKTSLETSEGTLEVDPTLNKALITQFFATLYNGNWELHKLKAKIIAIISPITQGRYKTRYKGKEIEKRKTTDYDYVFDAANNDIYAKLMENVLEKATIKFNNPDKAKEGIKLVTPKGNFITLKADNRMNLVYQIEVNGKTYTYTGMEIYYAEKGIDLGLRERLAGEKSVFNSDSFMNEQGNPILVNDDQGNKIEDPGAWNRYQLNRLLNFRTNTNMDIRIKGALEILNNELSKFNELEKEVFWNSLIGFPNSTLLRPLNLMSHQADKFTQDDYPNNSALIELASKVNDPSGRRFIQNFLRLSSQAFPGLGFDKATKLKRELEDGTISEEVLFEDVPNYDEERRADIRDGSVESEAVFLGKQFDNIFDIILNNNTEDIKEQGVISFVIDPLRNKLVPITKKMVSDWFSASPTTTERRAVSLEMVAGAKYYLFKNKLNAINTRHYKLSSDIEIAIRTIVENEEDLVKRGKKKVAKSRKEISSEINLLSENLPFKILNIDSPSLGNYAYLVDGVTYNSVEELLTAKGITDPNERLKLRSAIGIRTIYDWESIKIAESMVGYLEFVLNSLPDSFANRTIIEGYKNTWMKRLGQFNGMKGKYIPHTFRDQDVEPLLRMNAAYAYLADKNSKEEKKMTHEELMKEAERIMYDERFDEAVSKHTGISSASGGKVHNWDLKRVLKDFIVEGKYITDTMDIHDKHKEDLTGAVLSDFGIIESLLYEHNAFMMGKDKKLRDQMKLWYGLWSPSVYLRSNKMAINLNGKTKNLKQGDAISFYYNDPRSSKEKRVKFIVDREDSKYIYASIDKEAYRIQLQKSIEEVENLIAKIDDNPLSYSDLYVTEKYQRWLESLDISYSPDMGLAETADLLLSTLNEIMNDETTWGRFDKNRITVKQYFDNTVVASPGIERQMKSMNLLTGKLKEKFGEYGKYIPTTMAEFLRGMQAIASILTLRLTPSPAVRNMIEGHYKVATMIGIRRLFSPSFDNEAFQKFFKGEPKIISRMNSFRKEFNKKVMDGNIKPLFEAMKTAYRAKDIEQLNLIMNSNDPEVLDKLQILDSLVAKYLFEHGLGNVAEIGASYVDPDTDSRSSSSWFNKAERMNRIHGAYLFGYKAMFVDGVTDVKLIGQAIEKGVARAHGEYDMAYRALVERTPEGRLGNMYAQFTSYRRTVLKRLLEQAKEEGQIKPVISEIRKFHFGLAFENMFQNLKNVTEKELVIGEKTYKSGASVDMNIPRQLAKEFLIDLTVGQVAEFMNPGLRLVGPVNRLLNMPIRFLAAFLIAGDEPDDWDLSDVLFGLLGLRLGMFFTMPLQLLFNIAFDRERISPFNPKIVDIADKIGLIDIITNKQAPKGSLSKEWYEAGEVSKALISFNPLPFTRKYQSDLQNEITREVFPLRPIKFPFAVMEEIGMIR